MIELPPIIADLALFDSSKRFFWGNLLGAILLLLVIPGNNKRERFRRLFSRKIWFHPSSRADMKIIGINTVLRAILFPASILSATAFAALISLLLKYAFGPSALPSIPPTLMAIAFSLCLFLTDDFARFYMHYLQHKYPWLWAFHQTHHSALVLTPLTLLRTHPVEIVQARLRNAVTYGLVIGVFFYFAGESVSAWDVLGTEVMGFAFNFLGANLRHSEVWLHFGRFEPYFVSPAAHQLHHSIDEAHYDKNFGVCLTWWDRLFGTYMDPRTVEEKLSFGIKGSPLSAPEQSLKELYFTPFFDAWKALKRK